MGSRKSFRFMGLAEGIKSVLILISTGAFNGSVRLCLCIRVIKDLPSLPERITTADVPPLLVSLKKVRGGFGNPCLSLFLGYFDCEGIKRSKFMSIKE